jgi:hypothetical protein
MMQDERPEGLKRQAEDELQCCCQTLCDKEKVRRYIEFLEQENARLQELVKRSGGGN